MARKLRKTHDTIGESSRSAAKRALNRQADDDEGSAPAIPLFNELKSWYNKSRQYKREARQPYGFKDGPISSDMRRALVSDVVRYMLCKASTSPDQPVTREEISQRIGQTYKEHGGSKSTTFQLVDGTIKACQAYAIESLGMELACLKWEGDRGKLFTLRSIIPHEMGTVDTGYDNEREMGLLMVILVCIHQAQGEIPERELQNQLHQLGVQFREPGSSTKSKVETVGLGDADDLIASLIKNKFLLVRGAIGERLVSAGDQSKHFIDDEVLQEWSTKLVNAQPLT